MPLSVGIRLVSVPEEHLRGTRITCRFLLFKGHTGAVLYSHRMKKNVGFILLSIVLAFGAGCQGSGVTTGRVTSSVDLHGTGLTSVPSWVFARSDLEELNIADNQLTGALPGEIRHLPNLRALDASGNVMTGVPAEIGQLTALEYLDLSDNQLTGLPLELSNLTKLVTLDLHGNAIAAQDLVALRSALVGTAIIE